MESENLESDNTCRTCAEHFEDELVFIFNPKNTKLFKIFDSLSSNYNFKISRNDGLPQKICEKCLKELTHIYLFLLQCEKSEKILTEKVRKNSSDPIYTCKTELISNDDDIDDCDENYNNDTNSESINPFPNSYDGHQDCKNEPGNSDFLKEEVGDNSDEDNDIKESKIENNRRKRPLKDRRKKTKVTIEENEDVDLDKLFVKPKLRSSYYKKEYECDVCTLIFEKFIEYKAHRKAAHPVGSLTYLCDVCGKEFNKRDRLLQHKNRHTGLRPFKCNICDKTFAIKGSLRSHIKRHENPESYTCEICGKSFLIKRCYEEHLNRHENGDKLFKCPYCPRTFKLLSTLTHHCTFHNKTLDKKYHCSECNTNFRRSDHLKEHINGVHLKILPFKCELCPQAFVTGAKRNIHVKRMHSGRRYQCNLCEKDFSLPSSLNRHKKSHSGIKSLICEICNESFVTPSQIERHMATHPMDETIKNDLITQTYEKIKHIAINQEEITDSKYFDKIDYTTI